MGWVPGEVHEHEYDDAGRLVRTTVAREPEWDDYEREKMLALGLFEAGICECGFHESLAHDPNQWFDLKDKVCPLCADLAVRDRVRGKRDQAEADALKDKPSSPRASDGRRSFVQPMAAEEHEARVKARTT